MTFNPFRIFSLFSGNQGKEMTIQNDEQTIAGDAVKEARSNLEGLEADLKSTQKRVDSYRVKKQGYATELEVLQSKHDGDNSKLPYSMQLRILDLTKDVKELDSMIEYSSKQEELKHGIDMANLTLTAKQGVYQDLVRKENTALTSADIEELKHKTLVSMPMDEKMMWIGKLGSVEKLREYCPMV